MQALTKYWFLEEFDFAKKLGMKGQMELSQELKMDYVSKGEELNFQKVEVREVIFLKKGTVKIIDELSGQTKHLVKGSNIFGELDLDSDDYNDKTTGEFAVALEDLVVCRIPSKRMLLLMDKYAALKNHLLKIRQLKIRKLEIRLADLLYKTSEQRITDFVKKYIEEYGKETKNGREAKNLLSHNDIAHLTNTSRQTVNNVLSKLRRKGAISYSRKVITLNASNS